MMNNNKICVFIIDTYKGRDTLTRCSDLMEISIIWDRVLVTCHRGGTTLQHLYTYNLPWQLVLLTDTYHLAIWCKKQKMDHTLISIYSKVGPKHQKCKKHHIYTYIHTYILGYRLLWLYISIILCCDISYTILYEQ